RVQREVVRDRKAVARAERYAFGAAVRGAVFDDGRNQREVADHFAADAHRGARVRVDQGRRYAEQFDVVVETFARRFRRNVRDDVRRIELEQVANRVAVFLAVQAREAFAAGIRLEC